ncbi:TetR/AcrR family transcriptional regulator [Heyndrickxia sp. NPDC080065]|uniref:TetR/AcrR family transcriptional regulator n=1 Tax=Heyndrickxia sp. NPDC080065 TaxID=3390568 RepID=UPI003D014993
MNDRKQNVVKKAHQLFIDKGFQATSIQEIIDYSGISKGTFYNYFSSKSELLIAIFKTVHEKLEKDRNDLLIGQDPADIEIFIKQIELQMKTNKNNKLIVLIEEVMVLNDVELKEFIKQAQLRWVHWLYQRFLDIFGESKKAYLLDCAVMFMGILQHNLKYNEIAHKSNCSIHRVIRYSVDRLVKIVEEVSEAGDQLIEPKALERRLPNCQKTAQVFQQKLNQIVSEMKKGLDHDQSKYIELLDFIQEELLDSKNPRKFLIESALFSLKSDQALIEKKHLQKLDQLITEYLNTET